MWIPTEFFKTINFLKHLLSFKNVFRIFESFIEKKHLSGHVRILGKNFLFVSSISSSLESCFVRSVGGRGWQRGARGGGKGLGSRERAWDGVIRGEVTDGEESSHSAVLYRHRSCNNINPLVTNGYYSTPQFWDNINHIHGQLMMACDQPDRSYVTRDTRTRV
jgi:hypothetical protein